MRIPRVIMKIITEMKKIKYDKLFKSEMICTHPVSFNISFFVHTIYKNIGLSLRNESS